MPGSAQCGSCLVRAFNIHRNPYLIGIISKLCTILTNRRPAMISWFYRVSVCIRVSAKIFTYFTSKQTLPLGFAEQRRGVSSVESNFTGRDDSLLCCGSKLRSIGSSLTAFWFWSAPELTTLLEDGVLTEVYVLLENPQFFKDPCMSDNQPPIF